MRRKNSLEKKGKEKNKSPACRGLRGGEGSVSGLQLRVRFVPAALLAMLTKDCTGSPVCF